jgi:hypothetical protein
MRRQRTPGACLKVTRPPRPPRRNTARGRCGHTDKANTIKQAVNQTIICRVVDVDVQ